MHPDMYPVEQARFPAADTSPDVSLVVDIAGGLEHDIDKFKRVYPNNPDHAGVGTQTSTRTWKPLFPVLTRIHLK